MKKKSKINWIIDVVMFIDMMAMGGIGLLLKYSLITGSERWDVYGANVDLYQWGLERHQWGFIHLILGYILLGLLLLHILLHWKQIKAMFRNFIHQKATRVIITLLFVPISLVFLFFTFIFPLDVVPIKQGQSRQTLHRLEPARQESEEVREIQKVEARVKENIPVQREDSRPMHDDETHREKRSIEVFGSLTLSEVFRQYGVPADSLKQFLKIPFSASDRERLGRLRRRYNFQMSEIERYVEWYLQKRQ